MKKILTFLPAIFLSLSAYADDFGPNDKVLYFSSDVLIDVIKKTFATDLQLDVANKYVSVMDENGNVSIADLATVCATGNLDKDKCRNFIRDLIEAMGDGTIKPFYWVDYVSVGFGGGLNTYNSGDGYFHHNDVLGDGEWAIQFPWMKYPDQSFRKQYPDTEVLRGTSACTTESASARYATTDKNFAPNEQSGQHCWCKMTEPEQSAWVYYGDKTAGLGGTCERSCALGCMTQLRDESAMRSAMFTAVKLNGSNANTSTDDTIANNLNKEFKPCEFDWVNDTQLPNISWFELDDEGKEVWDGHKTRKVPFVKRQEYLKMLEDLGNKNNMIYIPSEPDKDHYAKKANGLNNEEWAAGGFNWMKSEKFQCKYPGVTKIKGVATCNNDKGTVGKPTNKQYKPNEATGPYCWCKMTYPETSKWVRIDNFEFYEQHVDVNTSACDSECLIWCGRHVAYYTRYDWALEGMCSSIEKK